MNAAQHMVSSHEQFRGSMLGEPEIAKPKTTDAGYSYVRIRFAVWPGQSAIVETTIKQAVVLEMRAIDPSFTDPMVAVHYREQSDNAGLPSPKVAAVVRKSTSNYRKGM